MNVARPGPISRRLLLVAVAFLVAVCGVIPTAQAHDYLVSSNPKANSTITVAPKNVTLTFDDIVLSKPARPQVTVTGPEGRYYETGCGTVRDTAVTTPVELGPAGKYTVTWRVVSADGHPVSADISFTYAGQPGANSGATTPKACTEAGSTPAAASKGSGSGVPTGAIVAVVVIAVILVGGAAYIVLTRGRTPRPGDGEDLDDEDRDDEE